MTMTGTDRPGAGASAPSSPVRASFLKAAPFWLSIPTIPLLWVGAIWGEWWLALAPLYTWGMYSTLDAIMGLDERNPDPDQPDEHLFWYRLVTLIWAPLQLVTIFGLLAYVGLGADHLAWWEHLALFLGVGVISGTIGIVYAHELMHQKPKVERWMGDLLMTSTLYGHFRSEHMLVHHRYVGTPRDAVTARFGESFYQTFARVLYDSLESAWHAEAAMLERKKLPWWHRSNPFWIYAGLQAAFLVLAWLLAGWWGVALFAFQAFVAIWHLELVNYVEHYGLTRAYLGNGRYEHVQPHHSWNAAHKASNWLLINLQRHSDHHYKPSRRFPLLQTYDETEAPNLPYGYPIMTAMAMIPGLWHATMDPLVQRWRARHYPHITDWAPYENGTLPYPR